MRGTDTKLEAYNTRYYICASEVSKQSFDAFESLRQQLAECERERDAYHTQLNNIYGCETCNGFPNLTDPRVSDAAFRAVFHDVTELKDWKSRETVELELATVTKERDELVAALEKASDLIDKHLKWDRRIDDDMDFIDGVLAKLDADKGEV